MTFADVVASAEPLIMKRLIRRTALANKLAKAVEGRRDRARLYQQKAAALSQLLLTGGARADEILVTRRVVTVRLADGCRQHVPIDMLSTDAKRMLCANVIDDFGTSPRAGDD